MKSPPGTRAPPYDAQSINDTIQPSADANPAPENR